MINLEKMEKGVIGRGLPHFSYTRSFHHPAGEDNYWTGYFTSRPSFKFHERQSHGVLQAAKQVQALLSAEAKINDNNHGVFALQEALAIAQHHDAITGTAKQHVDDDYNVRLA